MINSGITPIEINRAIETPKTISLKRGLGLGKAKIEELILFAKQLSTLFKAGIPIIRAMSGLVKYPDVFPSVFLSVMKVGESTGHLDGAFEQLSFYLERDKMIRDKIKEATRYPTFVLLFLAAAFAALNVFVIPEFAGISPGYFSANVGHDWQG